MCAPPRRRRRRRRNPKKRQKRSQNTAGQTTTTFWKTAPRLHQKLILIGPRLQNPTKNGTRNVPKSFQNQSSEKLENSTAPAPEAHFEGTWDSKNIQKWHPETTPNHSKITPRSKTHEFLENSTAPTPDAHFEGSRDSNNNPKWHPKRSNINPK